MLKLKKLHKALNGITIIDQVTAVFPTGTVSALVGPNGAGKTSLFHLITGEMRPDSGAVFYDREELSRLPAYQIARRGVGRLFQDVRVFANLTAWTISSPHVMAPVRKPHGRLSCISAVCGGKKEITLTGPSRFSPVLGSLTGKTPQPENFPLASKNSSPSAVFWPPTAPCCCLTNRPPD